MRIKVDKDLPRLAVQIGAFASGARGRDRSSTLWRDSARARAWDLTNPAGDISSCFLCLAQKLNDPAVQQAIE